jgi:hypothetical protein
MSRASAKKKMLLRMFVVPWLCRVRALPTALATRSAAAGARIFVRSMGVSFGR